VPTLHVSYHLGEHYNSVRSIADPCDGPAIAYPVSHILKEVQTPILQEAEEVKGQQPA